MNRSERQGVKSQWDEERPGTPGSRFTVRAALSKARACWKRPRFQALDAVALYFNLFGLFCHSSSTMQLAPLESPSPTKGEGDFQGCVYTFFSNSSVNSVRLPLASA